MQASDLDNGIPQVRLLLDLVANLTLDLVMLAEVAAMSDSQFDAYMTRKRRRPIIDYRLTPVR
jgi:heme O synthase-like polyprenyltransferase